jgi:hypothetical protein
MAFCVITPCSSEKSRRFEETYHLHLQDQRESQTTNEHEPGGSNQSISLYPHQLIIYGHFHIPLEITQPCS